MRGIAVLAFVLAIGGMVWYSQKKGDEPHLLWEKITKRGSEVTIENNIAHIITWTHEDTMAITDLLSAAGVNFEMFQSKKTLGKGWEVSFKFSDLVERMGRKFVEGCNK